VTISMDSVVCASEGQLSADLHGETVILGLDKAMYYGTDDVGSYIWDQLASPKKVSSIRDSILSYFDVASEICERDLLHFLEQLDKEELIHVMDDASR